MKNWYFNEKLVFELMICATKLEFRIPGSV